jgi:hypothetical protein
MAAPEPEEGLSTAKRGWIICLACAFLKFFALHLVRSHMAAARLDNFEPLANIGQYDLHLDENRAASLSSQECG